MGRVPSAAKHLFSGGMVASQADTRFGRLRNQRSSDHDNDGWLRVADKGVCRPKAATAMLQWNSAAQTAMSRTDAI